MCVAYDYTTLNSTQEYSKDDLPTTAFSYLQEHTFHLRQKCYSTWQRGDTDLSQATGRGRGEGPSGCVKQNTATRDRQADGETGAHHPVWRTTPAVVIEKITQPAASRQQKSSNYQLCVLASAVAIEFSLASQGYNFDFDKFLTPVYQVMFCYMTLVNTVLEGLVLWPGNVCPVYNIKVAATHYQCNPKVKNMRVENYNPCWKLPIWKWSYRTIFSQQEFTLTVIDWLVNSLLDYYNWVTFAQ